MEGKSIGDVAYEKPSRGIGVYTNMPSPHLTPLLAAISSRFADVFVVYAVDSEAYRSWDKPSHGDLRVATISPSASAASNVGFWRSVFCTLRWMSGAEVVVLGGSYLSRSFAGAYVTARLLRARVVFWGERPDRRTTGVRRVCRGFLLRILVRIVDEVWSVSGPGVAAYRALGGRSVHLVPYVVDIPSQWRAAEKHAVSDTVELVCLGSLTARKRPMLALRAFHLAVAAGLEGRLTFIGDGPLRDELEGFASKHGLPVRFTGNLSRKDVAGFLKGSHIVIHPAVEDGWGAAPVEAAVCGAAVIGSPWADSVLWLQSLADGGLPVVQIPSSDEPEDFAKAIAVYAEASGAEVAMAARRFAESVSRAVDPRTVASIAAARIEYLGRMHDEP